VPGQYSTGGKEKLLGISKRGNCYLRRLFVHEARSVLRCKDKQSSGLRAWLTGLTRHAHHNVVAVALANKLARITWAVLTKEVTYRWPLTSVTARHPSWCAIDAWQRTPGLEIASRFPQSHTQRRRNQLWTIGEK
jgi:hypothetical protein